MSERERWIVYPLLFFALGAGLRDKIVQQVTSKEIVCESLRIVDSRHPDQVLAELGAQPQGKAGGGRSLAFLQVDEILSQELVCDTMQVIDGPTRKPLVYLGTAKLPAFSNDPKQKQKRSGVILVRDNFDQGQVSEMRADQFLGNQIAGNALIVLPPVQHDTSIPAAQTTRFPLVLIGSKPVPQMSDGVETSVSYQGVIYLNDRPLTPLRVVPRSGGGNSGQ